MKLTKTYATTHSVERAKERMGVNEKRAVKDIQRASDRGKRADAFSSWERDYLDRHSADDSLAIAYNGFCYIFDTNAKICITLFRLPEWFGKKKNFDGKVKVKNPKKYYKLKGETS